MSDLITQIQPILAQIIIYPIKSLDGVVVNSAQISAGGSLLFDRRWAIVDGDSRIVNAKRTAKIQQLRAEFDLGSGLSIRIRSIDSNTIYTFSLTTELANLANWLSEFFNFPVSLVENTVNGFPDDLNAYGPTVISTATLETICEWFPDLDVAEVRRRFRTNLELSGVPAFWEDRLFATAQEIVDFQLGNVQFYGVNPCLRCVVPTRDSLTGKVTAKFQRTFNDRRQQTLPDWVNLARFDRFYRLAVNTQIPLIEAGKFLKIGDGLMIEE